MNMGKNWTFEKSLGNGFAGSQPMSTFVHMEPKNFGDLASYVTYGWNGQKAIKHYCPFTFIRYFKFEGFMSYNIILQVHRRRSRGDWRRCSQEVGQVEHCGRFEKCARHAAYN